MIGHVVSNVRHVAEVLLHGPVVVTVLAPVFGSFEVVIARSAIFVSAGFAPMRDHFLDPPLLCVDSAVQAVNFVSASEVNAFGDVFTLTIENVCQVEREECLISAHDEQVRIALRVDP